MKKFLSILTLLLAVCSGAWGATVSDLKTISSDRTVYFADIISAGISKGSLFDDGYLFSPDGNTYKTDQGTDGTINKLYCCRVKSDSQDAIAFKVSGTCTLVLYANRITDRTPFINDTKAAKADGDNSIDGTVTAVNKKTGYATYSIPSAGTYYIIGTGDCYLAGLVFTYPGTSYTMTAAVDDDAHGTATASPTSVKEGNSVTFTATNNTGWQFTKWTDTTTGDDVSTDNPYTISSVSADVSLTANFEAATTHTLTISAGETGALGIYYDNTVITQNEGTTVTLPVKNSYFYKEGYTATGWTDGTNDYAFGATLTLDKDYTIYPKFTANTESLAENAATVTWTLAKATADKIHIENTTGYVVTTATVGGETIDVPSYWNNTSGKIDNRSREDALAQVNGGSKFTIPAQKGMTITLNASYQIEATAAGDAMTATTTSPFTATYTYTGTEDEIEVVISGGSYFSTIVATYPGPVAAPSNLTITGTPAEAITLATSVTLTAAADGNPAPTYEWFQCDDANKTNPVSKGTEATLTPTLAIGTNYFYCVATNSEGSATSDVQAITVTARTDCALTKVVYSNSFDAFINAPTGESNGTIHAYYMAGTSAPTITSATISDGATYAVAGNTLTVTAEDGTTTADYDITLAAVNPFAGESLTFDGTETFIKTGYTFDSGKGWRFMKNADDGRIPQGKTRIYFFVGKAESVTLTNGLINSERNVKVYVNGVENTSITKVPKSSASPNTITIACNTDALNMIAVVSNQTGGDGGFSAMTVTNPDITGMTENIKPVYAKSTYVTANAVDFSGVEGLKAYVATAATAGKVTLSEVTAVPAGTPLMLIGTAGTEYTIPVAASATAPETNLLKAGDGKTEFDGTTYDYILYSDGLFYQIGSGTVALNKAYLHCESDPRAAAQGARSLSIVFEDETTGIGASLMNSERVNNEVYNLNGLRVAQPSKGLYIVNGKKVVVK